jgi:Zn-dependent protease
LHPTSLLLVGFLTFGSSVVYRVSLGPTGSEALVWAISLASALLLILSVLLHELGHSFVAMREGVKVRSITVFFLGGVAQTDSECRTARGEFLMAAAGPLVSILLGTGLLLGQHAASHLSPALGLMTERLGAANLLLAAFNLLPGLPLDGGRILKALVWQLTGSQRRGVEVANGCGRFLSLLAVGLGVWVTLKGLGFGLWLLLLGWFGLGAARSQQQLLLLQRLLGEMQVQDAAKRRFRVLEAADKLRAVSQMGLTPAPTPGHSAAGVTVQAAGLPDWLLVCDRGRWKGVIDEQPLRDLPVQRWDQERVGDHMRPLSSLPAIAEAAPLWQAVMALRQSPYPRLLVLGPAGLPCGTVERPDLAEAVLARMGVRVPEPWLAKARQLNAYPPGLPLESVAQLMQDSGSSGAGHTTS